MQKDICYSYTIYGVILSDLNFRIMFRLFPFLKKISETSKTILLYLVKLKYIVSGQFYCHLIW